MDALETVAGGVGDYIYQGLDRSSLSNGIKRTRFEPILINGIQTVGSESSVVRSLSRTGDVLPQRNRVSCVFFFVFFASGLLFGTFANKAYL